MEAGSSIKAYLHLDELLVVVFTQVVHQLHGHSLATHGIWTFAWLLNGPSLQVVEHFLATSCTPEESRPACTAYVRDSTALCRLSSSGSHVKSCTVTCFKVSHSSMLKRTERGVCMLSTLDQG